MHYYSSRLLLLPPSLSRYSVSTEDYLGPLTRSDLRKTKFYRLQVIKKRSVRICTRAACYARSLRFQLHPILFRTALLRSFPTLRLTRIPRWSRQLIIMRNRHGAIDYWNNRSAFEHRLLFIDSFLLFAIFLFIVARDPDIINSSSTKMINLHFRPSLI